MGFVPRSPSRLLAAAFAAALVALGLAPYALAQQSSNGWSERASMPVPRSETAVATLDGKIYVLGGYPGDRIPSDVVQVWDSRTDTWSLTTPLPMPMHHMPAIALDGKLYIPGGEFGGAGDGGPSVYLDTMYVYDPATAIWSARAPMPTGRSGSGAAVVDGKIYVVGGRPPAGHDFAVYDPRTDAWTVLPDLPTARNHITVDAIGGKIYVAGGRFGAGFQSELTDILEIYDPATNTWTRGPSMARVRSGMATAVVNDCLFSIGGEWDRSVPSGVFAEVEAYDPSRGVWHMLEPMVNPVHGLTGAGVIDGAIYLPGGAQTQGVSVVTTALQVYRPTLSCRS